MLAQKIQDFPINEPSPSPLTRHPLIYQITANHTNKQSCDNIPGKNKIKA